MPAFTDIIAERRCNHWIAWFRERPEMSCGGIDAVDAIGRLLGMYAEAYMDLEKMSVIDSETSDDHFEYRVPHINLWRFPIAPSEN